MTFKSFVRHVRLHHCLTFGHIVDGVVEIFAESLSGAAIVKIPVARIEKEKWSRLRDLCFNTLVLGDLEIYRHLGLLTDPDEEEDYGEDISGLPSIDVP